MKKLDVLQAQVERMLGDPKSQRFVRDFTDQWLKLRDIDFTVPDQQLYPEYNQLLGRSMLDETHAFFRELLDHDYSVQQFVDSDFVMINEPLARCLRHRRRKGTGNPPRRTTPVTAYEAAC